MFPTCQEAAGAGCQKPSFCDRGEGRKGVPLTLSAGFTIKARPTSGCSHADQDRRPPDPVPQESPPPSDPDGRCVPCCPGCRRCCGYGEVTSMQGSPAPRGPPRGEDA